MQRYGAHEVDYLEFAPAPFEVFEDLLPMDAGGKELQVGACGAGAAGSESQPYLAGAGSGDPAYRGRHRGGGFIWGRLGGARCLRIGFGEDRGTRSLPGRALPGWAYFGEDRGTRSLPGWALPGWALLGRRGDGSLGGAGSGDSAYKGGLGRRDGFMSEVAIV